MHVDKLHAILALWATVASLIAVFLGVKRFDLGRRDSEQGGRFLAKVIVCFVVGALGVAGAGWLMSSFPRSPSGDLVGVYGAQRYGVSAEEYGRCQRAIAQIVTSTLKLDRFGSSGDAYEALIEAGYQLAYLDARGWPGTEVPDFIADSLTNTISPQILSLERAEASLKGRFERWHSTFLDGCGALLPER